MREIDRGDASIIILIVLLGASLIGGVISALTVGSDKVVEEVAEDIIAHQTGIEVDLSPSTPE